MESISDIKSRVILDEDDNVLWEWVRDADSVRVAEWGRRSVGYARAA